MKRRAARISPADRNELGGGSTVVQTSQRQTNPDRAGAADPAATGADSFAAQEPASDGATCHSHSSDIDAWAGTSADIEVRRGDVLRIPKQPGFVLVSGQVYNASAITFAPGKSAGWYLQHAGGSTSAANRKEIFVIRANGSVVGRRSGEWYEPDVLVDPAATRRCSGRAAEDHTAHRCSGEICLSTAQIASSIAITAAVAGSSILQRVVRIRMQTEQLIAAKFEDKEMPRIG